MAAVFAGLEVTAERRRPTELDSRHDAALHAAKMAIVGETISLAMAAEYIRHLQFGMHRRRSGGRHHLERQAVERTLRLRDRRRRDMGIACCGREVKVTDRRTNQDFAECMRELVDLDYPDAPTIRVVMDNLSTHSAGALYDTFPAAEARRVLKRLEFHYTPRHASWLNMAEIEIGVLRSQCLDRRIDDTQDFVNELRSMNVRPHVAQNNNGRRSAIDGRTARHAGYAMSQTIRKRIEEGFGWIKTIAGQRKTRFRGRDRVGWAFTFAAAAYNLVRLPKLLEASV